MPSYKLTYFNARGKAEVARYMFKLNDVKFDDCRLDGNWQEIKPTTPFGSLPMMEVDGLKICQSGAIERLLAKKFGLYGKNQIEETVCDMVHGCGEDLAQGMFKAGQGATDEEKVEKKKKFSEEQLPNMMANFEKMVNGDGWFVGKEMMWADISIAHVLTFCDVMKLDLDLSKYPKVQALKQNVEKHPKIAAWIKIRPETNF